jgi:multimeric flavodoxin WrbA
MKKVVCVLGSPRKHGNSEMIAVKLANTAMELGAEVQTFRLHDLNYKGCYACMSCKTGYEYCVIKDDLKPVLEAVRDADAVVVTSPIYFGQVSGQLKCFIDRTYSFLKPDFFTNPQPSRIAPGKRMVFITTQGNPDESQFDVAPGYARFYKRLGFEPHFIRGLGLSPMTEPACDPDLMKQAEEMAKTLLA